MLLRLNCIPRKSRHYIYGSIRFIYSSSCRKQIEKLTFTELHSISPYSFKNELYIHSSHVNTLLFDFKYKISQIHDNKILINTIISTVTELSNYCESKSNFEKIIFKIYPILVNTLLKLEEPELFIHTFVTLSLLNVKIYDNRITDKFTYILNSPDVSLIEKYKLITCSLENLQNEENLGLSLLKFPLSMNQRKHISQSYCPEIVKSIITSFYLPLKDNNKIDEFFEILLSIDSSNKNNFTKYKLFLDLMLQNDKLNFHISKNSNIFQICTELSTYIKFKLEIPSSFSIDLFHEIFIKEYLTDVNYKVLYEYITLFYGDNIPSQFYNTGGLKHPMNSEVMEALSPLICKKGEIPMKIQVLLLEKAINKSNFELEEFIEEFKNPNTPFELLVNLKFLILRHTLEIFDRKSNVEYLMDFINYGERNIPGFDEVDIEYVFKYYKYDFEGFLTYMENVNRRSDYFKCLNTESINNILQSFGPRKKERIIQSILSNNLIPKDNSIVLKWFNENPKLINYMCFNNSLNPNNTDSVFLFRLFTLVKPSELLNIITKFGDEILCHNLILSSLTSYKPSFEFLCARLKCLHILKNKNYNLLDQLTKFMKRSHIYENKPLNEDQKFILYNIYCENVLNFGYFSGLILICNLIPSMKAEIIKLTGLTEVHMIEMDKNLILRGEYKLPFSLIKTIIQSYSNQKNCNGKVWVTMFKHIINEVSLIKDEVERDASYEYFFKYFQNISLSKEFGPITLLKLYQVAEFKKLNPEWKIKINISEYLENFFENDENFNDSKDSIAFIISTMSKYEYNLELSSSLVYKLFENVKLNDKLFFLVSLRNLLLNVPFVNNIHIFLRELFNENDPSVYKLFGLEIENPLIQNPNSKRAKWMRFDVRYFAPLMEIYMKDIISKEQNFAINQMMIDSIACMRWGNETSEKNMNFYKFYKDVVKFGNSDKINKLKTFDDYLEEFKYIFIENKVDIPGYMFNPFIYHFLYTRIFSYDLETIIKMVYVLNKGNEIVGKYGFWDIIEPVEELEKYFGISGKKYDINDDAELMKLFKLIFTAIKNSNNVSTKELTYIVNIAENMINSKETSKNNKYWILNCTVILMGKHSNILNTFIKKMQTLLPDYRVPNSVISELLYSTMINDSKELDNILDYLLESHDHYIMNQSSETIVKRLLSEEQNGLAQLYYAKYTERKPKFKILSLPDTLSWGKAKQPVVTIDSNDGVNMKMDKFRVKLYDYDSLDNSKNQ
ncbi:hypothetical protein C6P42_004125 [Pichia californica]|nr:hypothetical protein C6P42_004125 [[Candida] californica]